MADTMDAIALLKADHRKVEELFSQYEGARTANQKLKLAQQICLELAVHARIEEEIFYPACRGEIEGDLLDEAHVEHDGAKVLLAEIAAATPADTFFDAKVMVLSEMIEHHVKEEERRAEGMFAQAKKAGLDMDALGAQMAARKAELTATYRKSGVPTPETVTFQATHLAEAARAA